ncbi:MAG TPA: hypothetical protein VIO38_03420, partial [Rariglobus sp.]
MIGVIAEFEDREIAREFFELFKTPWEFYRKDRRYDVLLCAGSYEPEAAAKLTIFYGGKRTQSDDRPRHPRILLRQADRIPIYGDAVAFPEKKGALLTDEESGRCVAYVDHSEEGTVARVGYDLFAEIRFLLTEGQPAANAELPAVELHIALLRSLITDCGIPLVEIPPVPAGYRFIACLTHDVDHPSIRRHKWDHTTFGFLYRAILGSFREVLRGRLPIRGLTTNWMAAFRLVLVHLGLAKDFWSDFGERYLELEQGLPSTFFVIPFQGRPGRTREGAAPVYRAAPYGAQDIAGTLRKLSQAGCEIALHGIDAWCDASSGREELEEIRRLTGASDIGVRMHWLYYDGQSPQTLEEARASYDSTAGYNGTVGYRAGTTQVYKPPAACSLLELPLHAMDTALFYPAHRGLSQEEAKILLQRMVVNAARFGGCLTVNWHDRSTVPERLWGTCYRELI